MPRELEDSEHSDQSDDPEDGERHGLVVALLVGRDGRARRYHLLLLRHDGGQRDEVGDDGHQVDHVHDVLGEDVLGGAGQEPHQQLEGEPDDAERLHDEEGVGDVGHLVLLDLGAVGRGVEHLVVLELGEGLQAEDDDGEEDDEDGDDGHDARVLRRLRVLEEQPHLALEVVGWQGLLLLLDEALVFPGIKRSNDQFNERS